MVLRFKGLKMKYQKTQKEFKVDLNADLTAVGSIFAIIIILALFTQTQWLLHKQYQETLEVKKIAYELYESREALREVVHEQDRYSQELEAELKKSEKVQKLVKEIDRNWGTDKK